MIYIGNAFALSMLERVQQGIRCTPCTAAAVRLEGLDSRTDWESCLGHADIAALASAEVGFPIPANRKSVVLKHGDLLYVVQYTGPRLPEGTTILPEGAQLVWWQVEV